MTTAEQISNTTERKCQTTMGCGSAQCMLMSWRQRATAKAATVRMCHATQTAADARDTKNDTQVVANSESNCFRVLVLQEPLATLTPSSPIGAGPGRASSHT